MIKETYCKNGTSWGEGNITKSIVMKVMILTVLVPEQKNALKPTQSVSNPLPGTAENDSEAEKKKYTLRCFVLLLFFNA